MRLLNPSERCKGLITASAGYSPWYQPHAASFRNMPNARVLGSGRLPSKYQKKAWERWAVSISLRVLCEKLSVKLKVQRKPEVGKARNVKSCKVWQRWSKGEAKRVVATGNDLGARLPQAL